MVNDLNITNHKRPKLTIEDSKSPPLTHITDNPIEDSSNFDDQTNDSTNPTGITKCPKRLNKMARYKFFQNENNPFITKPMMILHNVILRQYKIPHYQIIQVSSQILNIIP